MTTPTLRLGACLLGVWLLCASTGAQAQSHVVLPGTWGRFVQAADQSGLNQPLTPADRLTVVGPHFMRVGPDNKPATRDDERVRLFGINLSHEANFPAPDRAKEVAATLRSLGFNAVRLHHMDTLPTDDPQSFKSSLTLGPYPSLHTGALSRLKQFIPALKQEGIYVNLNLMVGYQFRPQQDKVPALDDQGTPPDRGSPVHMFHPRLVELQTQHARRLLAYLNLGNDPVLAQVELVNEASLAAAWLHWDRGYWDRQIRGPYAQELTRQWHAWALVKHGSAKAACAAWQTCEGTLPGILSPTQADSLSLAAQGATFARLKQKAEDSVLKLSNQWGLGGGKPSMPATVHPLLRDFLAFVADTDRKFMNSLRDVVRASTRPDVPVTGTQANFGGPLNLLSHAQMDYVDVHHYTDHPDFPGGAWSWTDWRIRNSAVTGPDFVNLLNLSAYRDLSRPFVVSEFNQPYPNTQGHDIVPVMALLGAQQDWDGLYLFDYVDEHPDRNTPHNFNLQGDWARAALVGLSARIFRLATVPALAATQATSLAPETLFGATAKRRRPDALDLYWRNDLNVGTTQSLANRSGHGGNSSSGSSASGAVPPAALNHLAEERLLTANSPLVAAIIGEVAAEDTRVAGDLSVKVDRRAPKQNVTLLAHSLDGLPLKNAAAILLATPAFVVGSQPASLPPRPQKLIPYRGDKDWWTLEPAPPHQGEPSSPRSAIGPLWLERKPLRVGLTTSHPRIRVYPLGPKGERLAALPDSAVVKTPQGFDIALNHTKEQTALWFEIVRIP